MGLGFGARNPKWKKCMGDAGSWRWWSACAPGSLVTILPSCVYAMWDFVSLLFLFSLSQLRAQSRFPSPTPPPQPPHLVAWRLVCMCLLLFCGSVFAFASIKCIGALFYIEPSSLLCETGGWLDVSIWVMSQYLDLSLLWRGRAWRIKGGRGKRLVSYVSVIHNVEAMGGLLRECGIRFGAIFCHGCLKQCACLLVAIHMVFEA